MHLEDSLVFDLVHFAVFVLVPIDSEKEALIVDYVPGVLVIVCEEGTSLAPARFVCEGKPIVCRLPCFLPIDATQALKAHWMAPCSVTGAHVTRLDLRMYTCVQVLQGACCEMDM